MQDMTDALPESPKCAIPLYNRDRTLRAVTVVDPVDWGWASSYRWRCLGRNGHVSRGARLADRKGITEIFLHKEIAQRMGFDANERVMHRNGDVLDNRRENLITIRQFRRENPLARVRAHARQLPEPVERPCAYCGTKFTPRRKNPERQFCSQKCQRQGCIATEDSELQRDRANRRWEHRDGLRSLANANATVL